MAARSLSQTKPRDYRPPLLSLARYYAEEEAKRRIRAEGRKLSHYLPKDITRMSMTILEQQPEPFITQARETIARWIAADQKSEHLRNSRRAANGGFPLNESHAQNGAAL